MVLYLDHIGCLGDTLVMHALTRWPLGGLNGSLDWFQASFDDCWLKTILQDTQILQSEVSMYLVKFVLRWMTMDLIDHKSTLVQVMAWCHQATGHYLSHCWPWSLSPYGVTRPQRVKHIECWTKWPTLWRHLQMDLLVPLEIFWHLFKVSLKYVIRCSFRQ